MKIKSERSVSVCAFNYPSAGLLHNGPNAYSLFFSLSRAMTNSNKNTGQLRLSPLVLLLADK